MFSLVVRDEPSPLGPPGAACPAVVYGLKFSLAGTNRLAPAFLAAVGASWGVVGALAPFVVVVGAQGTSKRNRERDIGASRRWMLDLKATLRWWYGAVVRFICAAAR